MYIRPGAQCQEFASWRVGSWIRAHVGSCIQRSVRILHAGVSYLASAVVEPECDVERI